nr:MAG TPA: head tail connector [Caudoviricetes sp.]
MILILSFDEVKNYIKFDFEEGDEDEGIQEEIKFIKLCMTAAETYLKNATGKEYPELDEEGNKPDYSLEKIYLGMLIADMYEKRTPVCNDNQSFIAKSMLLQLQLSD